MNPLFVVALSIFRRHGRHDKCKEFALGGPFVEVESIGQNGILLWPGSAQIKVRAKVECTNAKNLESNLDYLSEITDAAEILVSEESISEKNIEASGFSATQKPEELVVPVQKLFMAAEVYQDLTEKMNEIIESDVACTNYVENKQDDVVGDKLTQSCAKVKAEVYLKEYKATVEKCKDNFKNAIAPKVLKINKGIDDLTMKYNDEEVDIVAAKKEIEERTLILSEIKTSKSKSEKATTEFGICIANKGNECETFMQGIYSEFKKLLG